MVEAAPVLGMDGEMDEQNEDMDGQDPEEGEAMEDEDDDGDENGEKNEYVKKEFVARTWDSETLAKTIEQVEAFSIKNTR